jgi:ectoine hydrolase
MEQLGVDLLFVSDPANMAWLTGYDGWSFYACQGVWVGPGGEPVWWGRAQDEDGAGFTTWLSADNIRPYPESYTQSAHRHPVETLVAQWREAGFARARIGVEMDNFYFTARAFELIREHLPDARLTDATGLVNWQRAVKSAEELAFMRKAGRISEKITDNIITRIEPGLRKNELVAGILHDGITGVDNDWGDYPAILPLMPSGARAAAPHLTWNGQPYESGEVVQFEISGCYRRYHAPFCRTIFLGTPPPDMVQTATVLVEGIEAGLEAAAAGNRAADVAHALKRVLASAGIEREGRVGYPVGLAYPPDWGERTISLREDDDTILEPGMTFHFMPGLWHRGWGLEITETIVVKEKGPAECLVNSPRELVIKP